MDDELEQDPEPSLDALSQAFAQAMSKQHGENPSHGPGDEGDDGTADAATPSGAATAIEQDPGEQPNGPRNMAEVAVPAAADPCPISPQSILEAVLFVGHPENEPVTAKRVASLLRNVDVDEIEALIEELNAAYDQEAMPFQIRACGDGYRLELRAEFEHIQERFYGRVRQARLSQHAIDVLAVVAYNQPITRENVDRLLSNTQSSQRVLNQLVRRDLLACQVGHDPKVRRQEYVTTDRFLDLFQLSHVGDLPRVEEPQ